MGRHLILRFPQVYFNSIANVGLGILIQSTSAEPFTVSEIETVKPYGAARCRILAARVSSDSVG
jgi:hypothetical protein